MSYRARNLYCWWLACWGLASLPPIGWKTVAANEVLVTQSPDQKISQEQREFFEQRIRPVLVEHCYECHNSSDNAEAGLALDDRDGLRRGSDEHTILGSDGSLDPSSSRLLAVLRHELDGLEMPAGGPKLDRRVIDDFERWIAMGAPDPRDQPPAPEELSQVTSWDAQLARRKRHWCFQPIQEPAPPGVDQDWSEQAIDGFLLARMRQHELQPSQPAPRQVLIRRLSYALIGLPPTPEQVESFLADGSPDAYERLVDELLNSPNFGERWARHWMDWVRYAESHGSEGDPQIEGIHHYRDYLIRALNQDVPYDQLLKEHIAGDLLPSPRINDELGINESLIGTAHWRMVFHGFAPTDALDEKVRFTDDAINVFSKAFLGLTVSCARCHDHKFDAISQADYYALFGVLGSVRPGRAAIETPDRLQLHRQQLDELKPQIRGVLARAWQDQLSNVRQLPEFLLQALQLDGNELGDEAVAKAWQHHHARLAQELKRSREFFQQPHLQYWDLSRPEDYADWFRYGTGLDEQPSFAGEFAVAESADSILAGIYPAGVYSHLISTKHSGRLTSPDFAASPDSRLVLQVVGSNQATSRYVVHNYPRDGTVYAVREMKGNKYLRWKWEAYDLDYWQGDQVHIELATANDAPLLVKHQPRSWFGIRRALVVPKDGPPLPSGEIELLTDWFEAAAKRPPQTAGDLRALSIGTLDTAVQAWARGEASDSQALMLNRCLTEGLLPNSPAEVPGAGKLLDQYRRLEREIPTATRIPTLSEWRGSDQRLFERGDHRRPSSLVPRRFLEAIDATPYETGLSGRLELAQDMLRADNPLTSRVIVNRIWHHLFGRGLVATPDNFGRLGDRPTHPELLDYLASQFRDQDSWSIKTLIRRIVTSRAWRQDSRPSEQARRRDPQNLWLSHFRVQRLEAEAIRDSLLAVSGRLDPQLLGPPVGGASHRRSIYVRVKRNQLDSLLMAFDAPVPFSTTGRRDVTNVPAQSLLLMNHPQVRDWARAFALPSSQPQSVREQIIRMWQSALQRSPTSDELQHSQRFIADLQQTYQRVRDQRVQLEQRLHEAEERIEEILSPVRAQLQQTSVSSVDRPVAMARWDFATLDDRRGSLKLQLRGTAKLDAGQLILDGQGWAQSPPIASRLGAKSLEVQVQLDSIDQRGGGVFTVQDLKGDVFDALVFGERRPKRWLAGSNHFQRTTDFDGVDESELATLHLVLVYTSAGEVTLYRNGQVVGRPYQRPLQVFEAGEAQVLFGLRHGTAAAGNRLLRGRIQEAALYDRALTANEVSALATLATGSVRRSQIVAKLTEQQRSQIRELDQVVRSTKSQMEQINVPAQQEAWVDLAHSLFNMKEFIYVR